MVLTRLLQGRYFSIGNPVQLLDRWFHSYCHHRAIILNGKKLRVQWNGRAERALCNRREPLVIEMQLYFSCVVKKRVLFHDPADFETTGVNDNIQIAFRPIQAAACDPEEFARNYPVGRVLNAPAATRMIPSKISIDFRKGRWQGEFGFEA